MRAVIAIHNSHHYLLPPLPLPFPPLPHKSPLFTFDFARAFLQGTVAELSAAAEVTAERCAEVAALEAALAERGAALDVQAESLALVTQENTLLREHEAAMEGALEALQV